jgi:hypothetical protein
MLYFDNRKQYVFRVQAPIYRLKALPAFHQSKRISAVNNYRAKLAICEVKNTKIWFLTVKEDFPRKFKAKSSFFSRAWCLKDNNLPLKIMSIPIGN